MEDAPKAKRFLVALSFPGEKRAFVRKVAAILVKRLGRDRVFYDETFTAELARKDLDLYLGNLYGQESLLLVPFYCKDYEGKKWCQLEWRQMRAILLDPRNAARVMPFRFDDTPISGVSSLDGYVSINDRPPKYVAALILERLRMVRPLSTAPEPDKPSSRGSTATRWLATLIARHPMRYLAGALLALAIAWFARPVAYPVELAYINQYESDAGYFLHLTVRSTNGDTVFLPRDRFGADVGLEEELVAKMTPEQRMKLIASAKVAAIDSKAVADAAGRGLSYLNGSASVICTPQPRDLFLLITVPGPGSANPSARFQLGRAYRSIRVHVRKSLMRWHYVEVPIRHPDWLAGNSRTKILGE